MKHQIELFIVVATVAILAGIILPAFNQAKEKAKQADCTSHLAQIGKASFIYAMSYDDWFPTTAKISAPKWMDDCSGDSFDLFRTQDLLADSSMYICRSKKDITAAGRGESFKGHVSYNWCEGLIAETSTLSPIACDGVDNHKDNTGRFVRGDGSVGIARGSDSRIWTYDPEFRDYCYEKTYTDYSF